MVGDRVDGRYGMELYGTANVGNCMLQQIGAWKYRNGNARRSARAVVQQHNEHAFHIKGALAVIAVFFLASVLETAGHFRLLCKGGWVREGSRSMSDGVTGDDEIVMGESQV